MQLKVIILLFLRKVINKVKNKTAEHTISYINIPELARNKAFSE